MLKARDADLVAHGDDLIAQLRGLQERTLEILQAAEASGDLRTALLAIREARGNTELTSKLTGQLVERHRHETLVLPPEEARRLTEAFARVARDLQERKRLQLPHVLDSGHIYQGEAALPGYNRAK